MAKNNLTKINGIDVSSKRIISEIREEYKEKISTAVIIIRFGVNQ